MISYKLWWWYDTKFRLPITERNKFNHKFMFNYKHLANDIDISIYKNEVKHHLPMEYFNEGKCFILKHFKRDKLIYLKEYNIVINHKNVE